MSNILVISPHPDDESIGCGGALRRHVVQGDFVHAVFLTSGEQGGHGRDSKETAHLRESEAQAAAHVLGLATVDFWREPDGGIAVRDDLVKRLQTLNEKLHPTVLYVTHDGEMHPDHKAAVEIVRAAFSGVPSRPRVLMYEVWTPLAEIHHIEDISEYIETKLAAIRTHKTQCEVLRFDEAMLGLNRYRGEMHSWPGGPYAEVFKKLKFPDCP